MRKLNEESNLKGTQAFAQFSNHSKKSDQSIEHTKQQICTSSKFVAVQQPHSVEFLQELFLILFRFMIKCNV
eukprot:jgi/Hompol1/1226/HPOL_002672-RA